MSITIRGSVRQGQPATALGRVTGLGGARVTQGSLLSITRRVYDLTGETPAVAESETELVVADVVYDALQTGAAWTADGTGYNFADTIPAEAFAEAGHVYRITYTFVPAAGQGEPFVVPAVAPAE